VTGQSVPLESILSCFEGVVPSPFATCSAKGTPNITYMSIVHYLDSDRVALSRQFFNKTRANLDANPRAQVLLVEPESFQQYRLDLEYVHTESEGAIFEAMKANLDAVASQQGMGDVFRLRGVDIHRVIGCARVGDRGDAKARPEPERDMRVSSASFTSRVTTSVSSDLTTNGSCGYSAAIWPRPSACLQPTNMRALQPSRLLRRPRQQRRAPSRSATTRPMTACSSRAST